MTDNRLLYNGLTERKRRGSGRKGLNLRGKDGYRQDGAGFAAAFRPGRRFGGFFRQESDTEELADKTVVSSVRRTHMPRMGLMVRTFFTG